jgi:hypothetical protein
MLCLGGPLHGLHRRSAVLRGVLGSLALLALGASPAFALAPATGAISVVSGPEAQAVYLDGSAVYTYDVSSTGGTTVSGVTLADDHCPAVTGPDTTVAVDPDNNADDLLQPGETWRYACTVKAADLFKASTATVTSTATATAIDQNEATLSAHDTVLTAALIPGIAIDKTGPATATASELLTYNLAVTDTGTTSFPEAGVKLTDTVLTGGACDAAPTVATSKNGDRTPAELNPGETWVYQCQVATKVGDTKVSNKGDVSATDAGGRTVTASDTTDTALSPAVGAVLPATAVSGRARLSGSVGCVASRSATARVTGAHIRKVTFTVNGRKVKTLTRANSGGAFQLTLSTSSLSYGPHNVRAVVEFASNAVPRTRTLNLQFSRCRARVVTPTFAG